MTWQAFGSLAAGNQPLSLFDTLSANIAQCVTNPCTAAGTNAITLTLNANAGPITAYNNFQRLSFVAAATSTGAVTIQLGSLATVNLYKPGNIAAGSGDLTSGVYYEIAFNQALNTGAGGFVITSATPASVSLPITVTNGGTGLTSLTTFAPLCGGTGVTANVQQATTGFSTVGAVLTSQGASALPTWVVASSGSGLVSIQVFSTSQTVTIPAGATKAAIWLQAGGGGTNTNGVTTLNGGASGAGLFKYLSGLTAGNTLALTVGAAGTNTAVNNTNAGQGGSTILASGTQTITTLTATGGLGSNNTTAGNNQFPLGSAATNGDLNFTGRQTEQVSQGGGCPFGIVSLSNTPAVSILGGLSFGSGAVNISTTAAMNQGGVVSATAGFALVQWFT